MSSPRRPGRRPERESAFARPPRQPRVPLTRDAVVAAAVAVLDAEGTDALTFRRLAAELHAGVASLYWHVDSKDALLDLALDAVLGEVVDTMQADTRRTWQDRLRTAGLEFYDAMIMHRWAAAQMIRSNDRGPNTLRLWELVGGILADAGLGLPQGFDALSLLLNHVLASGVQEATWDPTGALSATERRRQLHESGNFLRSLDPSRFPIVAASADIFESHDQREQFAAGLDVIIAGLEARLA